jgi:hypothetical protein
MKSIAVCLILTGFMTPLLAQEVTGNLEGRLVDPDGMSVIGANISVQSASLQGLRGTTSDKNGWFHVLYLPPGLYTIKISHIAFQSQIVENLKINLGKTVRLGTIGLQRKTIELGETKVTATRLQIDARSSASGMNMARETFAELPIDRNYRSVAGLLPHANVSFLGDEVNIAGASGSENRYFIDGVDVSDPFRGLAGMNLPYNFIREIQVKAGGYEAEYRSALGGVINAVTFSGGNEFSGQLFGFFNNNNFSTEYRLAEIEPPKKTFSQYDAGFVIGGPIKKDKLWFSVAYNPSSRKEEINIPGSGYFPDQTTVHSFAGKLTWKSSDRLDIGAMIIGDPSIEQAVAKIPGIIMTILDTGNPDPLLSENRSGGYGSMVNGRYLISKDAVLQASMSWKTRTDKSMPRTARGWNEPFYFDLEKASASDGDGLRFAFTSTAIMGSASITYRLGQHMLKGGSEYKNVELDCYNNLVALNRLNDSTYLANYQIQKGLLINRLPALYAQDAWTITDRISLNVGIRWDGLYIIAPNGRMAQKIIDQIQPRIGGSLLLGSGRASRLFFSLGRYADELLMYGSTVYHLGGRQVGLAWTADPRRGSAGWDMTQADTIFVLGGSIAAGIKDLQGQYYDECSAGYEYTISPKLKITTRGIYRTLGNILEDCEYPPGSGQFIYANPGRSPLQAWPRPVRNYKALELSVQTTPTSAVNFLASYVLSQNKGNWTGMYYSDFPSATPNSTPQFDFADIMTNSNGLLPNDRTHVLKINGFYKTHLGMTCGFSLIWQSGTPLSEMGGSMHGQWWPLFLTTRGSLGRLPSLWDMNLRLAYELFHESAARIKPRLIMDIFHVGSQKTCIQQDQWHYWGQNSAGQSVDPSPTYGLPQRFQPPMAMRLGMEVIF